MGTKSSKSILKKEDRISRMATFISNMAVNEEIKLTPFAKRIGVHVNSLKDLLDSWEVIKDAGKIDIIRDKTGKIKRIVRVKEANRDLSFKKEIRDSLSNINNKIDELSEEILETKKK